MTSYYSFAYLLLFMPILAILYNIFPQKKRWMLLLCASYIFFISISGKLLVYLILSTISIHYIGLWLTLTQNDLDNEIVGLDKNNKKLVKKRYKKKKLLIVIGAVIFHIGTLLVLKYLAFFNTNINSLFIALNIPITLVVPKFMMPIGISFYTLQAVSYILDIYRGTIKADKNLFRLALFMSFFPQIMEGPICRYEDTAFQLWEGKSITYESLTFGVQRILFGMMKKMVVADRLHPFITTIFSMEQYHSGSVIALGAIAYTCQLYMEFSGTMDIVIGSAEIFGIQMPENFKQPFFSKTISEFWTRWHITLGTWFKDYVFYPVSMSKPLKVLTSTARKKVGNYYGPLIGGAIALFCVWLCNGLWHGVGWHYIFFGLYHFVLILAGNIFTPAVVKITDYFHVNRNHFLYGLIQIIKTCILVCIGELIFRADGLKIAFSMMNIMIKDFSLKPLTDYTIYSLGIDFYDFIIVCITVLIVFIISYLKEKGISIRSEIAKKNIIIRWVIYYAMIIFIIMFGAYGNGYVSVDPIYANF